MPDLPVWDTTDPAVRATLVKQAGREQDRCDYWAAALEQHPDCADSAVALDDARDALAGYLTVLADGPRR